MNIPTYFAEIRKEIEKNYVVAREARAKGLDPKDEVEIPLAMSLAERVTGLLSVKYPQLKDERIIQRIKELEKEFGLLDHAVAVKIAEEIAQEKFCKFENQLEAIDAGIRVGFAYITVGVVSSPLEGFTHLKIKKTKEGRSYFSPFYSGPVRSAGGTAAAFSLLLVDHLREIFGYAKYDPTENEIKRAAIEITDYHERITNLQYLPSEEEVLFLVKHLPVQIDGDASEVKEVSNYKDLQRVETNFLRNGFCLVLAEGLAQKSHKILKIINNLRKKGFKLSDWDFLNEFVELKKKWDEKKKKESSTATYISDLVAGRPVLGHPSRKGGFRLRYGRCRFSGLSSMAMSPYTMAVLNDYIAIGTQLKYEGPGKSSAMTPCDSIDGPIVKTEDNSVIKINNNEKLRIARERKIIEILHLGDFLVNYGEYFNRGKRFQIPGYCPEWYCAELESKKPEDDLSKELIKNFLFKISFEQAVYLSSKYDIPLHPDFIYYWAHLDEDLFLGLLDWISVSKFDKKLIFPYNKTEKEKFAKGKRALELLGIEHEISTENVILNPENSMILLFNLGVESFDKLDEKMDFIAKKIKQEPSSILELINKICRFKIKDKAGSYIGARMGRPEKAKLRKLTGSPNVLFPVGQEGGRFRSVNEALKSGGVKSDFPFFYCPNCKKETIFRKCEDCSSKTLAKYFCDRCGKEILEKCQMHERKNAFKNIKIDIQHYFLKAVEKLGMMRHEVPVLIKGVKGTSSIEHNTEVLEKGILRAKHNLQVNKDGTIRYDMTEQALTHFKPVEIGTSIEKLKQLGYEKDINNQVLENENQLIEIFPMDIILPSCPETEDEKADDVFISVSKFVDEMLVKLYDLPSFYNVKTKYDLIGHLVIGLAPHTSGGIIGRIIGFSQTQGCISSPLWHAAQRRDCEGDETCVMLLLEALINFSKQYLPAHRGATQDAPLVVTGILNPAEVDDMVFDMDIVWKYPLELYEAAESEKFPWEIKIEQIVKRLNTEAQYYNFGFTHNVENINNAVRYSAYKSIPDMHGKVEGQMDIAKKIRAVDQGDVARLIIDKHFMKDLKGNLRKFSQQNFRCSTCNEIFRRPPLDGKCTKCNGRIIFTIAYGSIVKYLEPAISLAKNFDVSEYIRQDLELTKKYIESIFGRETEKQEGLKKWF